MEVGKLLCDKDKQRILYIEEARGEVKSSKKSK